MTAGWFQQVRIWTVPYENWNDVEYSHAVNTAHGLEDGSQAPVAPGVWPDMSPTQVDSWTAYVFDGATYYDIGRSYVTISDYSPVAGADRVGITVGSGLVDECWKRNIQAVSVVIVALPHVPHSEERQNTDLSENFPPAGAVGAPFWAMPPGAGLDLETVYVDPVNGVDTDDGHTTTTPWETMEKVQSYMEEVGTFYHSFMVVMQNGPVGEWDAARSDFGPSGVRFVGNARPYFVGSADFVTNPAAVRYGPRSAVGVTANVDKQAVLGVAGGATATVNDHGHIRMTPTGIEWNRLDTGVPVTLVAGDIGKTIIFEGGNGEIAYGTIAAVDGQAAPQVSRWVEVNVNNPLFAGVPAWVVADGTTWTILDPDDGDGAQYTRVAGQWWLQGIKVQSGNDLAGHAGDVLNAHGCISHIVFTAEQVIS